MSVDGGTRDNRHTQEPCGSPRCGVTSYSGPGGELAQLQGEPHAQDGGTGKREVQMLGVWGCWEGKARSLSAAAQIFLETQATEWLGEGSVSR